MRFENRVAVVTGAASGIGLATSQGLLAEGAKVVMADREIPRLEAAAAGMPPDRILLRAVDVADEAGVEELVTDVVATWGAIDTLSNNAGISIGYELAPDQNMEEWHKIMAVNLYGIVHFTKHVSRVMRNAAKGAIVNTASVAGIRSGAGGNAYSASKAGVINFTQTSACDLGQWNIRVNAVCPGLIETGMTKRVFERARALKKEDKLGSRCELRRYGRPEEVAAAILFLASDDASYITGQVLPVDGGNTASLNLPGMKV